MNEKNLDKVYDPTAVEKRWAPRWEEAALTAPDPGTDADPFTMVMPPPNITGALHVGHALNATLQDILARYKRMKGFNVLWLPGLDHAGIATQNVVERQLAKEGVDRHTLGRDEFIERVWGWRETYGDRILIQLKRLGASCDWTRLRFTMDSGLSKAVREVFTRLYAEELIYRGNYIINWCPRCHTALSDLEVNMEEADGKLYYMSYPIKDPKGDLKRLSVATTRPETMLGDTAVAVNPADERYSALIGSSVELPFTGRLIPIVGDPSVSMELGTGAVKVTPAHDFNDFEIARRHDLPSINVMNESAWMNSNAGKFEGLDRFAARKKLVAELKEQGLLDKVEDHKLFIGSCYRCATVVEPRLSIQWFVKVGPLAGPAIKAVEDGRIKFVPKSWEKTYFEWMHNIRDWCISRQIWWGHRIPAWHCSDCSHITVATADPTECAECSSSKITQDPDVLDTWFSSALWPFSTLGWPEETPDLKSFYPTSVLSTSFDIIFFWVARMIMMGLKFAGDVPFAEVYIHALIRDFEGKKMSKSKGNVIDPLSMMDEYGTDALRFTLAAFASQGRDIKLAEERIAGYRNFCNKLWNLARFTLMNLEEGFEEASPNQDERSGADLWILTKLARCASEVEISLDSYQFDRAARALYSFVWHELCDWYVELIKPDLWGDNGDDRKKAAAGVLLAVLKDTLKLLHPFMPFITEEINSQLPAAKGLLMQERYPEGLELWEGEEARMEAVMDVIKAVRNIRMDMNVPLGAEVDCTCFAIDDAVRSALTDGEGYIARLAKVKGLTVLYDGKAPDGAVSAITSGGEVSQSDASVVEVFVTLKGHVDFDLEIKRLTKGLEKARGEHSAVEKKLANDAFVKKAPPEVVEKERVKLGAMVEKISKLETGLERIRKLSE
jgi:valyl-tRNA synthetase